MSVVFEAAIGWAIGKAGDTGLENLKAHLKKRAAKLELAAIGTSAMEAAIVVAPAFAEDFRSEPFLKDVLAPALIAALANPGETWDAQALADKYLTRFVQPYLRNRSQAETLAKVFHSDPASVRAAFVAFLERLRKALLASTHWKEPARDNTLMDVREGLARLTQIVIAQTSPDVSFEQSRADAKEGSKALGQWRRDIQGEEIERPELTKLLKRIDEQPRGRTLLIGEAGAGKSALLAKLTDVLQERGTPVFAIKADLIPADVVDLADLSRALGLEARIDSEIEVLAYGGPMVVLIDQLDAVSDIMDRTSQRMRVLLSLANEVARPNGPNGPSLPVHVIVSSRPFEAAHDARFQSLGAETITLALPETKDIEALLEKVGVPIEAAPPALRETLRRPFALRLFVELAVRGELPQELAASGLLMAWLKSAKLGDGAKRAETIAFLETLAADMTETETLWRPVDLYEFDHLEALASAQASGLIVRQGPRIGFSHQSWLDDFQARKLATAGQLCAYIWSRQDGLFSRATALRALQRLRAVEEDQYLAAIDLLLGEVRSRRHVRHLVVDLIATQTQPLGREQAWVYRLIQNDAALGRRAIGKVVDRWPAFREGLTPLLPQIMTDQAIRWGAAAIVRAEAAIDVASAEALLLRYWDDPELDMLTLDVCWRAVLWSPGIEARLIGIFQRDGVNDYTVSEYAAALISAGNPQAAGQLVRLFLRHAPPEAFAQADFDALEKLVEDAALDVARALMSWLVELTEGGEAARESYYVGQYPRLAKPRLGYGLNDGADNLLSMLRAALTALAKSQPDVLLELLQPAFAIELDEVQGLVAEMLAQAAPALLQESLAFLLADPRRLICGDAYVSDVEGSGRVAHGWSSQALVTAIAPHLSEPDLIKLRDAIEAWDKYKPEARAESKGDDYRWRLRYAEWARMPLLEPLPDTVIAPRRRRQIQEWREKEPRLLGRDSGRRMASIVGSPMSSEQMGKATDKQILRMLDLIDDTVDSMTARHQRGRGRWPNNGGVSQLSSAFDVFAAAHPERAIAIVNQLDPSRQCNVAGSAVRALASVKTIEPRWIVGWIRELNAKGFDGGEWRREISWALGDIARQADGLEDAEIAFLEAWMTPHEPPKPLNPDYKVPAAKAKESEKQPAHPVIFGQGGRFGIVTQGNFNMLSTIHQGLLLRPEPQWDAWLAVLERHLDMPEDPEVWTSVLGRGDVLFKADRARVTAFLNALWGRCPEAFADSGAIDFTWSCRGLMPEPVVEGLLNHWLASLDPAQRQMAGEYATALLLLGEGTPATDEIAQRLVEGAEPAGHLGALFAAAAAWREGDPGLRAAGHSVLTSAIPCADEDVATAVASAVNRRATLAPDNHTRAMLGLIGEDERLLGSALQGRFSRTLHKLLLHPGFEEVVLTFIERAAAAAAQGSGPRRVRVGDDLVAISIALQRGDGPHRRRAMDVYELLLDADAYGAEQAAVSALRA